MKIDKALRKQNRNKKIYFISMFFLAMFLPMITFLASIKSKFILIFLLIIEVLIFLSIIIKINYYKLEFMCTINRLRFSNGLFSNKNLVLCDKVAIIHTNKDKEDMEIIIVTNMKFKNKKLKPITKGFVRKYPEIEKEYKKLQKRNPEIIYYFQIVRRGALKKYLMLDQIYRNCVNASYTNSAIENIKIARGQNDIF